MNRLVTLSVLMLHYRLFITLSANFEVTLSGPILLHYLGDFAILSVSCYIIGKFGVTLSVDATL